MVTTQFLEDARSCSTLFLRCAHSADRIWVATAWASDGSDVATALWRARARLQSLVVGLDFHQTDPTFLRRFRAWTRVHETADGTFHPKVYVFQRGTRFDAILGSSNLTRAGFSSNTEANVHLSGSSRDQLFDDLVTYVEDLARTARQMLPETLAAYEKQWRARRKDVRRASSYRPPRKRTTANGTLAMHMDWSSFVREMAARSRKTHPIFPSADDPGYVGIARDVQRLFKRYKRLARMSEEQRRQVAGLVRPYGCFGWMVGAGRFRRYVSREPLRLDRALDHIPLEGDVTRRHFNAFVERIRRSRGLGSPAVGSRLLAMKRPDRFLCLDSKNRKGLGESFGIPSARLNTYEGYFELMELLWGCPWCDAPRPSGREGQIWDARVALVDAFFYQP